MDKILHHQDDDDPIIYRVLTIPVQNNPYTKSLFRSSKKGTKFLLKVTR